MKAFLLICSLCCFILFSMGCSNLMKVSDSRLIAHYITAEKLRHHLAVISSDSLEGREMATDGESKASAYISKTFRDLQLQNPEGTNEYLQRFEVIRDSMNEAMLTIEGKEFSLRKYGYMDLALNTDADFTTDTIVFVGYGIDTEQYSDYKNIDVRGKIVLICDHEPKTDSTNYLITGTSSKSAWSRHHEGDEKKIACAKAHGAKGVIAYSEGFDTLGAQFSIWSMLDYHPPKDIELEQNNIYASIGRGALRALVGEEKEQKIFSAVRNRALLGPSFIINKAIRYHFTKDRRYRTASNVVGYIEGTDKKDEYVIISAHYDHLGKRGNVVFNGADDNGSGTSSLLTIAEAFSAAAASGKRPRRSVVFVSFTGEEKGMFGSKYYVEHPLFPLEQTVADVNTDMIGRIDSAHENDKNYLYVIGDGRLSSELPVINKRNNKKYTHLFLDYRFDARDDPNKFYYRSDHYEFARKKIPITFYSAGIHKDYHRPTDTIDKIDFAIMESRARLIFLTTWEIANRAKRLKQDRSGE